MKSNTRIIFFVILILAAIATGCAFNNNAKTAPEKKLPHPVLSLAEFRAYVGSPRAIIFDARSRQEFAAGHVPGALSLPAEDFDNAYTGLESRLAPSRKHLVVVYCSSQWCGLADDLQRKLVELGFQHVGEFPAGFDVWSAAGLPVEK